MPYIADLHIHSRYSRACSRDLILENIDKTCRIKGVDIIATGDFTFPDWFRALSEKLEEISLPNSSAGSGLYKLKTVADDKIKFLLSTELALIYKQGDKVRRIHIMVMAPNLAAVAELNKYLDKKFTYEPTFAEENSSNKLVQEKNKLRTFQKQQFENKLATLRENFTNSIRIQASDLVKKMAYSFKTGPVKILNTHSFVEIEDNEYTGNVLVEAKIKDEIKTYALPVKKGKIELVASI